MSTKPKAATERQDMGKTPQGEPISKIEMYGWTIVDKPGRFRQIEKELLNIDPDYQRDRVVMARVLQIAAEWSWVRLGVLHVAEREDGTLWVFDGQHRKLGADRRSDIQKLPCMVYTSAGSQYEAREFLNLQTGRSPLRAIDTFKARLVAGDATAIQTAAMIEAAGYRIARSSGRHIIQCVGSIYGAVRQNSIAAKTVWDLCMKIYAGEQLHEAVYDALFHLENFLGKQDPPQTLNTKLHRERLAAVGPDEVLKAINAAKAYHARGGPRIGAAGVVKLLNKDRRTNKVPSPLGEE